MADGLPDSAEMVRILTKRTGRGIVIFCVFTYACYGWIVWSIFTGNYSAAVGTFLSSILFSLGVDHVRKRDKALRSVAANPQLVYWGHASIVTDAMRKHPAGNVNPVTVHLRSGEQVEATLAPDEAQAFVEWLRRENPSINWGVYPEADAGNANQQNRST